MFIPYHHARFGLINAIKSTRDIEKGEELLCHYNIPYDISPSWYQEKWRKGNIFNWIQLNFDTLNVLRELVIVKRFCVFLEIDDDWLDGPWGDRGKRKRNGEEILPLLTDSQLYKEFYHYASNVLKLDPIS